MLSRSGRTTKSQNPTDIVEGHSLLVLGYYKHHFTEPVTEDSLRGNLPQGEAQQRKLRTCFYFNTTFPSTTLLLKSVDESEKVRHKSH